MNIFVDIDNTICHTEGTDYENSVPDKGMIQQINDLVDQGHQITYWTARGSKTGKDWSDYTKKQLRSWGVRYFDLLFGKPAYDLLIDDKAVTSSDLNRMKTGQLKIIP